MEIKRSVVKKLVEEYYELQQELINEKKDGRYKKKFIITTTKSGKRIITSMIKNRSSWYAIVCFYDSSYRVDVYDRHVFDRYEERFIKKGTTKDIIHDFIWRDNCSGTLIIEPNGEFSKRIPDGAVFGNITDDDSIIYHKTFLPESMLVEQLINIEC